MLKTIGYLELAQLNSELAEAYLNQAVKELSIVIKKLEACLKLKAEFTQA